jgi:hypothetical protein
MIELWVNSRKLIASEPEMEYNWIIGEFRVN